MVDTDGDGLTDSQVNGTPQSDPTLDDTDGDGLNDFEEVNVLLTDPTSIDPMVMASMTALIRCRSTTLKHRFTSNFTSSTRSEIGGDQERVPHQPTWAYLVLEAYQP